MVTFNIDGHERYHPFIELSGRVSVRSVLPDVDDTSDEESGVVVCDEDPPEPEGRCGILYSECNF